MAKSNPFHLNFLLHLCLVKFRLYLPLILLCSCSGGSENLDVAVTDTYKAVEFHGNAQGTTFSIICNDSLQVTSDEIEKILIDFDNALSSWIDSSTVSYINRSGGGVISFKDESGYFARCYNLTQEVYALSGGAFDPTVQKLWQAWGFEGDGDIPDSSVVDSLRSFVGFTPGLHFLFSSVPDSNGTLTIQKITPGAALGFDGIAQGLTVDVIAEMLEAKGAKNYYVEIGGEIRVLGLNSDGELWKIGIDEPTDNSDAENRTVQKVIELKDKSIATSGSYRKFFIRDGVRYSHTIDPKTGRPVEHSLLSVSVVSNSCALSDGLATAFMVMGADSSMQFVNSHPELDVDLYLIFENEKGRLETFYTKGFRDEVLE